MRTIGRGLIQPMIFLNPSEGYGDLGWEVIKQIDSLIPAENQRFVMTKKQYQTVHRLIETAEAWLEEKVADNEQFVFGPNTNEVLCAVYDEVFGTKRYSRVPMMNHTYALYHYVSVVCYVIKILTMHFEQLNSRCSPYSFSKDNKNFEQLPWSSVPLKLCKDHLRVLSCSDAPLEFKLEAVKNAADAISVYAWSVQFR